LFTDGFFDIDALSVNLVATLEDTFVDGVIIVKFDKAEASGFTGIFFCQTCDGSDFSKCFEILSDIIFGHFLFEASNEDFFNGLSCLGLTKFFSRSCSFGFNRFSIDSVRPVLLTCIDFLVLCKCDEAKTSGPLCIWELHDYYIN